jgi:hypothetical protein
MANYDHITDERLKELAVEHPSQAHVFEAMLAERTAKQATEFGLADTVAVAGQGALMGWGDEALAGLQTGFGFLGDYDQARDANRAYLDDLRNQNPGAYTAAELAGGVAAGFVPGLNGLQAINRAKTLGQLAYNTGKVGAGYGAVAGAGYSDEEGLGGLAYDTAVGAGQGALVNSAIGSVVPLARAAVNRGKSPTQIIADISQEAGLSPEKVVARMKELGPEATLADAFPKLRETAYGAYGVGGFIDEMGDLTSRNQTAGKRLLDDMEEQTGRKPGDVRREEEFLQSQKAERAALEYSVLDDEFVSFDDALPILKSKSNSSAVGEVLKDLEDTTGLTLEAMQESGRVPARVLQEIRSIAGEAAEDLANRGKPRRARILTDRVSEIDNQLRQIPGWDKARQNFADASAEIKALNTGRTAGRTANKIDEDQGILEGVLSDTPRNRAAYELGAQQQILDNILASGGANDTGSVLTRLGNPRQQEIKLQGAGIPGFSKNLDRERAFNETYMMLGENQNSKTNAGRVATENFADDSSIATGALRTMGDPTIAGLDALTSVMKKTYGLKSKNAARAVLRKLLQRGMSEEEILAVLDTEQGAKKLMGIIQGYSGVTGRLGPSAVGVLQDRRTQ